MVDMSVLIVFLEKQVNYGIFVNQSDVRKVGTMC